MSKDEITHYAFIDVETTGLEKHRDPIIEIALILTDIDLNWVTSYEAPIQPWPGLLKARLESNDFVREMHTKNGLLREIESGNCVRTEEAEFHVRKIIEKCGYKKVMIAGSGVAQFDQQVIRLQMPSVDELLAYYPMDIGVIRRFIKYTLNRPDLLLSQRESDHRARGDVHRALDEARYYRDCFGHIPHPVESELP